MHALAVVGCLLGSVAVGDPVIIGDGDVITRMDFELGVFEGQSFVLGPGTEFRVLDGGVVGSLPLSVGDDLDFMGSSIVLERGASLVPGSLPDEFGGGGAVTIYVGDGAVVGNRLSTFGASGVFSDITIDGGSVGDFLRTVATSIELRTGSIGRGFFASTNTSIVQTGGSIGPSVSLLSNASLVLDDGVIASGMAANELASLTINGGRIGSNLAIRAGATMLWSGGSIGRGLTVEPASSVAVFGGSFSLDGVPVVSGPVTGISGDSVLSGVLSDGTPFIISGLATDQVADATTLLVQSPIPDTPPAHYLVSSGTAPPWLLPGQSLELSGDGVVLDDFVAIGAEIDILGGEVFPGFRCVVSEVLISGGRFFGASAFLDDSTVRVTGGSLGNQNSVGAGSVLVIDGGSAGNNLSVRAGSTVDLESGEVGQALFLGDGCEFNFKGGSLNTFFSRVDSGATFNVHAREATLNSTPIVGVPGDRVIVDAQAGGILSAVLSDGTSTDIEVSNAFGTPLSFAMGSELAVVFVSGCAADLAPPFGSLNFFDISTFISLYSAGDPGADLAAPFGTLNFFDISAFIGLYNAGCP